MDTTQNNETDVLLLRPDAVCRTLGLSRSTVYKMLESGELPSMRVGKAIRVPVAALRQWVKANTSEAKS